MFVLSRSLALLCVMSPVCAEDEPGCQRAKVVAAAYAEMVGVVEGVLYSYAKIGKVEGVCISGAPKDQVRAIGAVLQSSAFAENPVLMDDVPSRGQAEKFLTRFFPCER
jgi:hypothetical protein